MFKNMLPKNFDKILNFKLEHQQDHELLATLTFKMRDKLINHHYNLLLRHSNKIKIKYYLLLAPHLFHSHADRKSSLKSCGEEKEFRPINFNFISFLNWYFCWNAASWFFYFILLLFLMHAYVCIKKILPSHSLNIWFQFEWIWMHFRRAQQI